jgi:hypothetical protein
MSLTQYQSLPITLEELSYLQEAGFDLSNLEIAYQSSLYDQAV